MNYNLEHIKCFPCTKELHPYEEEVNREIHADSIVSIFALFAYHCVQKRTS